MVGKEVEQVMEILARLLPGTHHPGEDVAKPLQPAHKGPSLPLLNPMVPSVQVGQWSLVFVRDQTGPLLFSTRFLFLALALALG